MNKLRISQEGLSLALPAEDITKLLGVSEKEATPKKAASRKMPLSINKENLNGGNSMPASAARQEKSIASKKPAATIKNEVEEENEVISHHPQMIDEDVETFTHKLDSLILTFRTDSLKEFMRIKRNVLTEQSQKIEAEKNRCAALLSSKQDELERVKDELVLANSQSKRATTQVERLSAYLKKYNRHRMVFFYKAFAGWRDVVQQKKQRKRMLAIRLAHHKKMVKGKAFGGWRRDYTVYKKKKNKEQEDQRVKEEISKITQQYAKEIDMLNTQLKDANQTIEAENRNKIRMQENLKKAFMRGVCALNLEAMSALNPGAGAMDFLGMDAGMMGAAMEQNFLATDSVLQTPKENVVEPTPMPMMNEPKIESKDHMWKPAPILAKDFSNPTVVRPMTQAMGPTMGVTMKIDGRSAMLLENKRELEANTIGTMGEQEIKCERIPQDINGGIDSDIYEEGVETRSFSSTKQTISMHQTAEIPPEGKVIRVNKYGKSYTDHSRRMDSTTNFNMKPKPKAPLADKKKSVLRK